MVSVNDLNLVIEDVRESFQLFLNNSPRDTNEEIRNELLALRSEILANIEEVEKPIIELDATMIVQRKLPKLNLVGPKKKTYSL